ncbi:hypothetical protein ACNAWD_28910 [Rhodococcus erythropolis]|nr:hypothetical protein [Rhodococcus erythropolis]
MKLLAILPSEAMTGIFDFALAGEQIAASRLSRFAGNAHCTLDGGTRPS